MPDNARDLVIYAVGLAICMVLVLGLLLHSWAAAIGGIFGGGGYVIYSGLKNIRRREAEGRSSEWRWRR